MCSYCGGGFATSLIARETLSNDLSNVATSIWKKLKEWFPPPSRENNLEQQQQQTEGSSSTSIFVTALETAWDLTKSATVSFFTSIVEMGKRLWKLKDKEWSKSAEQAQQIQLENSSNGDPQQQQQQRVATFRDFVNGFLILCHGVYRDVFDVEIGTVFYLLWGVLVDSGSFEWKWEWSTFTSLSQALGKGMDERVKELLKLLFFLNLVGEQKRKTHKPNNGDQSSNQQTKYKLTRNNMKWATYSAEAQSSSS
ncbi:hypothetical protein MSUIS_07210 [Mycoplasma suis KI3806]|uniref:Uncharacterized protein n=1 Tax=Mycoplasma suis (strain KI_3806) TaxID=708248 RepID=F0V2D3_MYCS3|nr:hypothetical protein [Mycoplasma suis]CBZ40814.1 hypothetical protein MSUIS_07210 [Mycoplasma suis KI3806]